MDTTLSRTRPADAPGVLGTGALMIAHCAGMVDLVALPVWVGTLIGAYRLDPQQAGLLATLFLAGAVLGSLFFSPRLNRLPARFMAATEVEWQRRVQWSTLLVPRAPRTMRMKT